MNPFKEEHVLFRKSVRDFLNKEVAPHLEEWEDKECVPRSLWKRMGELGFLGLRYPEEDGGSGADYWYTVVLTEELSKLLCGGVSMGITTHMSMALPALARHGSPGLKKQFLTPAIQGEMIASIAVTEPGAGSDVASIQTRARRDGDHYIVNGRKMFITNGTQADFITTLVKTDAEKGHHGFTLLIIPTKTPGFSVGRKLKKLGMRSSDTAELIFDNVRVPVSNRIGEEGKGFQYQMRQFQDERLSACVSASSSTAELFERTRTYVHERKVFGKPIVGFQVNQHKMVDMLTQITALRALVYQCCQRYVDGDDITRDVSMCKIFAGQVIQYVADTCLQLHGGYGYMEEFPMARAYRDSRLFRIGAGSDEIMKEIVSKIEGFVETGAPRVEKETGAPRAT